MKKKTLNNIRKTGRKKKRKYKIPI